MDAILNKANNNAINWNRGVRRPYEKAIALHHWTFLRSWKSIPGNLSALTQ